jgi:hypothetical protein
MSPYTCNFQNHVRRASTATLFDFNPCLSLLYSAPYVCVGAVVVRKLGMYRRHGSISTPFFYPAITITIGHSTLYYVPQLSVGTFQYHRPVASQYRRYGSIYLAILLPCHHNRDWPLHTVLCYTTISRHSPHLRACTYLMTVVQITHSTTHIPAIKRI